MVGPEDRPMFSSPPTSLVAHPAPLPGAVGRAV